MYVTLIKVSTLLLFSWSSINGAAAYEDGKTGVRAGQIVGEREDETDEALCIRFQITRAWGTTVMLWWEQLFSQVTQRIPECRLASSAERKPVEPGAR